MNERPLPPEEAKGYTELLSTLSEAMRVVNRITALHADLLKLKSHVHRTFQARFRPAVPIEESVFPDHLICLIDGAKVKIMRRHLVKYGLNEDAYRFMFNLPADYPMVPPLYSQERADIARKSKMWNEVDHTVQRKRRRQKAAGAKEAATETTEPEAVAETAGQGRSTKRAHKKSA